MIKFVPHGYVAELVLQNGIESGRLLDIGFGPGYLLHALSHKAPNLELFGVDISSNMIAFAKRTFLKNASGKKVEISIGSACELPFMDNSFDLAVSSSFLHMLEDAVPYLHETVRVLKPSGISTIFCFRRDVVGMIRAIGYLQTYVNHVLKMSTDGMGKVFDSSYTASEVDSILRDIPGIEWKIDQNIFRMQITIKKKF